jgi:hypothetical protein
MATKTSAIPTKPKTAVAVRKASAGNIVSIQEALKAQVADLGNRVAPPSGIKIRATQDKKFILPDGTTTPGPLKLVIVDFAAVHNFYEGAYNKDDVGPPACFAVGTNPKKMVPAANVPNKQAVDCQVCPMNEYGSAGTGKACNNGRLMAVLPPDADANTPLWLLQASATAIKGFDSYVSEVARTFQSMPISVVTTVEFDENVTYAKMVFSDPEPNPNISEHFARQGEARELLFAERDVSGYQPVSKPGNGKKAGVRR